ncbi:MAG TPA: hypothetical protein VFQ05_17335, partial [Candidatus Eisenbacteria bacterium]|nr:hypothetical protein [Candidatus Eisenbacteria bacterium]
MRRRCSVSLLKLPLALVAVAALSGCSKDSTSPDNGTACDQKVSAARASLENALYAEINSDPDRPSDINFQATYQLYQEALSCSPTSSEANFGSSVLGLLALTSDSEVNAAFDEWEAYLESGTPFAVPPARRKPLGVPLSFASGPEA